ncbi:UbiA family prenyltransferase [bacterium]|nr:UbiA family prenyltransferase [bacterium]
MLETNTGCRRPLIHRVLDHLFFFRPLLILPIWAPLLLGYWASGGRESECGYPFLLVLGFFLGGWIYGLNQIYDIEGDRINRKNLPLALGLMGVNSAWIMTIASALLALATGFFISIWTGLFTLVGLFMGYLYSHPRFGYKDKPWPALILNGAGHGALVYIIGWCSGGRLDWMLLLRMLPYALAFSGVYIATAIPDIAGDRITKKNTVAVIWGEKKSAIISLVLIILASVSGVFLWEPALFLTGLVALPFYIYALSKGGTAFVRANKVAVLFLNLWICFYVFSYFLFLLVVIIGSRFYYSKRLGVKYP